MTFNKLSQEVKYNGKVYTLAEMLDSGQACVTKSDTFYAPRAKKGYVTAYFVDVIENGEVTSSGWRIGQKAYESRIAKGQGIPENTPKQDGSGYIPEKQAHSYMVQLENNRPEFFYNSLLPALQSFFATGSVSINPPIMGAFTEIGLFNSKERAKDFYYYWTT